MADKQRYNTHLLYTSLIQYQPARVPVIWAEVQEDIPPWDWTRNADPYQAWFDTPENVALRSWWLFAPEAPNHLAFPRLVRLHAADIEWLLDNAKTTLPMDDATNDDEQLFNVVVHRELAKLWKLAASEDSSAIGSRFRQAVIKAVKGIGILDPSPGGMDSINDWYFASLECYFWLDLLRFIEVRVFPLDDIDWNNLEELWGLRPAVSIDDLPAKGVFVHGLIRKTRSLGGNAPNRLEFCQAIATGYFLPTFQRALGGNIFFDYNDYSETFQAMVGALTWALFELSKLYRGNEFRVCKNENCSYGKVFIPEDPREKYCCFKCRHNRINELTIERTPKSERISILNKQKLPQQCHNYHRKWQNETV